MAISVKKRWSMGVAVAVVLVLAVALLSGVRGCGGGGADFSPADFPVRGIDISAHNGNDIDFQAVRAAGYSFVIFKASEGSSFKDRRFFANIARARRAGLKVGAYHFFRFDATGYMQALNFANSLRGQQLDLPVVIDLEQWTNPSESTRKVVETLRSLIHLLESRGHHVMIYTNKDGYERFVQGRFDDYPLWIASMKSFSTPERWTIWQYSHSGNVEGVKGAVDLDVFNGSVNQWEQWCADVSPLMQ